MLDTVLHALLLARPTLKKGVNQVQIVYTAKYRLLNHRNDYHL